ncbi:MAG: SagB/ThcOx family dehydrogenase [bacterium]
MKKRLKYTLISIISIVAVIIVAFLIIMPFNKDDDSARAGESEKKAEVVKLPQPVLKGEMTVEEVLYRRRSVRQYSDEPLLLTTVSQLLWSAQGITDKKEGLRTAPSAGALYPLEVYLVAGNVIDLDCGVYKYSSDGHELILFLDSDMRDELYKSALFQLPVREAPIVIVITGVYERTTEKYGERGIRYVHMEAGHCAENIYLQATALNLGTVVIGAFNDEKVKKVLNLPEDEQPLYIMPVGKIKTGS